MPVVTALRNPGMRDRHWDDLSSTLKFELRPDDRFTLRHATETLRLHDELSVKRERLPGACTLIEYYLKVGYMHLYGETDEEQAYSRAHAWSCWQIPCATRLRAMES